MINKDEKRLEKFETVILRMVVIQIYLLRVKVSYMLGETDLLLVHESLVQIPECY